jgi:hypothetical protein
MHLAHLGLGTACSSSILIMAIWKYRQPMRNASRGTNTPPSNAWHSANIVFLKTRAASDFPRNRAKRKGMRSYLQLLIPLIGGSVVGRVPRERSVYFLFAHQLYAGTYYSFSPHRARLSLGVNHASTKAHLESLSLTCFSSTSSPLTESLIITASPCSAETVSVIGMPVKSPFVTPANVGSVPSNRRCTGIKAS